MKIIVYTVLNAFTITWMIYSNKIYIKNVYENFVSKIYKELLKINNKKTATSFQMHKWLKHSLHQRRYLHRRKRLLNSKNMTSVAGRV